MPLFTLNCSDPLFQADRVLWPVFTFFILIPALIQWYRFAQLHFSFSKNKLSRVNSKSLHSLNLPRHSANISNAHNANGNTTPTAAAIFGKDGRRKKMSYRAPSTSKITSNPSMLPNQLNSTDGNTFNGNTMSITLVPNSTIINAALKDQMPEPATLYRMRSSSAKRPDGIPERKSPPQTAAPLSNALHRLTIEENSTALYQSSSASTAAPSSPGRSNTLPGTSALPPMASGQPAAPAPLVVLTEKEAECLQTENKSEDKCQPAHKFSPPLSSHSILSRTTLPNDTTHTQVEVLSNSISPPSSRHGSDARPLPPMLPNAPPSLTLQLPSQTSSVAHPPTPTPPASHINLPPTPVVPVPSVLCKAPSNTHTRRSSAHDLDDDIPAGRIALLWIQSYVTLFDLRFVYYSERRNPVAPLQHFVLFAFILTSLLFLPRLFATSLPVNDFGCEQADWALQLQEYCATFRSCLILSCLFYGSYVAIVNIYIAVNLSTPPKWVKTVHWICAVSSSLFLELSVTWRESIDRDWPKGVAEIVGCAILLVPPICIWIAYRKVVAVFESIVRRDSGLAPAPNTATATPLSSPTNRGSTIASRNKPKKSVSFIKRAQNFMSATPSANVRGSPSAAASGTTGHINELLGRFRRILVAILTSIFFLNPLLLLLAVTELRDWDSPFVDPDHAMPIDDIGYLHFVGCVLGFFVFWISPKEETETQTDAPAQTPKI